MIKKLAFVMMLFPLSAYATYPAPTPNPTTSIKVDNDSYSRSQALANSKSVANAGAVSGSVSGANAQGGTSSANGGSSSAGSDSNSGGNTISSTYNQVRQTPFAYSPGLAASFSQDNCANSGSGGVGQGLFSISGGFPIESDDCNRRKDVAMWLATGQPRIACERMTDDEANSEAMKRAGLDCSKLTAQAAPVAVVQPVRGSNVPTDAQWDRMEQLREAQFSAIMAKRKHKR